MIVEQSSAGDTVRVAVTFTDRETNELSAPSVIKYKVDCLTNDQAGQWIDVASPAAELTLEIGRPAVDIIDAANARELKRLVVYAHAGDPALAEVGHAKFFVINVGALPALQ